MRICFVRRNLSTAFIALSAFALVSCEVGASSVSGAPHASSASADSGGGGAATAATSTTSVVPYDLTLNWAANNESAVNRAGGGYRIYYSATSGLALVSTPSITVPYVSGLTAPTTVTITGLTIHKPFPVFVRIIAFSALVTKAGATATSVVSNEFPILVP